MLRSGKIICGWARNSALSAWIQTVFTSTLSHMLSCYFMVTATNNIRLCFLLSWKKTFSLMHQYFSTEGHMASYGCPGDFKVGTSENHVNGDGLRYKINSGNGWATKGKKIRRTVRQRLRILVQMVHIYWYLHFKGTISHLFKIYVTTQ